MEQHGRKRVTSLLLGVLAAAAISLAHATSASAAIYTVTDLGTLGGEASWATAINNAGEITGASENAFSGPFKSHGFRWREGKMSELGPCQLEVFPVIHVERCLEYSEGKAINAAGEIVGVTGSLGGQRAGVWHADNSPGLGYSPENEAFADGINHRGGVVGGGGAFGRAWVIDEAGRTFLGPEIVRGGVAHGINNRDEVVGTTRTETSGSNVHGFLYSGGVIHDLGTLGGPESSAIAINASGVIVGDSQTTEAQPRHAFVYRNGKMHDLGTLGGNQSEALAINDFGAIVGTSGEAKGGLFGVTSTANGHAFLDIFGVMFDLNALIPSNSGWTLETATGINDFGEIVGTGAHNGIERAFLLSLHFGW